MQQFELYQITNQHHADLRAQARAERMMDKRRNRSELIAESLAFGAFIAMLCLFWVLA